MSEILNVQPVKPGAQGFYHHHKKPEPHIDFKKTVISKEFASYLDEKVLEFYSKKH